MHNRAQARAFERHFGRRSLWAYDPKLHRFVSTANYSPKPGATLYVAVKNVKKLHIKLVAVHKAHTAVAKSTGTTSGAGSSGASNSSSSGSSGSSSSSGSTSGSTTTTTKSTASAGTTAAGATGKTVVKTTTATTVPKATTTTVPKATTTTTTAPKATTTTTTTTTTQPPRAAAVAATGSITTNDSKSNCIFMNVPNGVLSDALISSYEATTGVNYNCIEIFSDADPQWSDWVNPWPTRTPWDNWDSWLAESPSHQIVLGQQLIPAAVCQSVCSDPLAWESACAAGAYNSYATELGQNLVSEGAGNTVLRLGKEFNGSWENDYIGSPSDSNYQLEEQDWAKCFDNEVSAMRAVPGAHFLFDWNPAACDGNFDFANAYPGNSYVDIIGIDDYDLDCTDLQTVGAAKPEGWNLFFTNGILTSSLSNIVAFAQTEGKPISFPEWGEDNGYGDDSTFVSDMASLVKNNNTAYESYFDCNCDTIAPLGSDIPNSTSAYAAAFG